MQRTCLWLCIGMLLLGNAPILSQQPAAVSSSTSQNTVVPPQVSFSGVLTDLNGKPLTGVVGVTFALYREQQGGAPLWLETQNVYPNKAGRYTVLLGSTRAEGIPADLFVAGEARWMGVQVQGQAEQLRVSLSSVPYAMKATDAQTVGGLPASAFILAPSASTGSTATPGAAGSTAVTVSPAAPGTQNYVPLWTDNIGTLGNSVVYQTGTGATARIGVGTTTPGSTLDVKGASTVRGLFSLPAKGTATASAGFTSQPLKLTASVFNSGTATAVPQNFQWQAEPLGNNTAGATGTLNLLYATGTNPLAETGLSIASNGRITFAAGQLFPGAGSGSVTSVATGSGLTGGPITTSGTLSIDPAIVPRLAAVNTFTGNQTVNGNVSATGVVTGSSFQIGSKLFGFGSSASGNAYVGFAGNTTATGTANTGTGAYALYSASTAGGNTADGYAALYADTTGYNNTAVGSATLYANTTGSFNTGTGADTLSRNTEGSYNTAIGSTALSYNTTGINNTASGYQALYSNSTGYYNTAMGSTALHNNTTASGNTAMGYQALYGNSTGASNTATGFQALFTNNTGYGNTANGAGALSANTSGYQNVADGTNALRSNTQGVGNVAVGYPALNANTTGSYNTGVGGGALSYNNTGMWNTAVGAAALSTNTTGSYNTALGNLANVGSAALTNATAIGASAQVTQSNSLVLGSINGVNGASASTNVGIGTTAPAFTLDVRGTSRFAQTAANGVSVLVNDNSSGGIGVNASGGSHGVIGTGSNHGVMGYHTSGSGMGIYGYSSSDIGVYGYGPNYAGFFNGNVAVFGTLSKNGGSFKIDHPLDPANKYLSHSFVESPDMMNIYNGIVRLDVHGRATVTLPDYFESLNRDFRYQLTAIGAPGPNLYVAQEIANGQFSIAGGKPGAKVSWQVTGIRQDAYANAHRIRVEEAKPPNEQGRYMHPELFGAGPEKAIGVRSREPLNAPPPETARAAQAEK